MAAITWIRGGPRRTRTDKSFQALFYRHRFKGVMMALIGYFIAMIIERSRQLPSGDVDWSALRSSALNAIATTSKSGSDKKDTEPPLASDEHQVLPCDDLFHHPENFERCIRQSRRPSCSPEQSRQWNEAVELRYEKLRGSCVHPDAKNEGSYGPSGPGSSMPSTQALRDLLPTVFKDLKITTFMDCPCGDWLWMQTVDLSSVMYWGGDITNVTIKENSRCFAKDNVRFLEFDLTCKTPPPVDLLLVRDVLFHLSDDTVLDILANINRSGAKYLATTTFARGKGLWQNRNAYPELLEKRLKEGNGVIGFQRINLYGPPYHFPDPLYAAKEEADRQVGVWKLPLNHVDFGGRTV